MAVNPYYTRMLPYAQRASASTGIPAQVILAQWALESKFGTSPAATEGNNHAGIKTSGSNRKYKSVDDFVADYIATIQLKYYDDVRARAKAGAAPSEVAVALGESPWDATHYATGGPGQPGWQLNSIITRDGLDALVSAAAGTVNAAVGDFGPASGSPSVTDRIVGAALGIPGVGDVVEASADAVGATVGATSGTLALASKALSVLTSAGFWKRAGLVAAGAALVGAGMYLLVQDSTRKAMTGGKPPVPPVS